MRRSLTTPCYVLLSSLLLSSFASARPNPDIAESSIAVSATGDWSPSPTDITALDQPLDEAPKPTCWDSPPSSDFHCVEALHAFLRSIDQKQSYLVTKFLYPWPVKQFRVPKIFTAGTCRFTIDLHDKFPLVHVTGAWMREWAEYVVEVCIKDESNSAGGNIWVPFKDRMKIKENDIVFDFSSTIAPGLDFQNMTGGTGVLNTTSANASYPLRLGVSSSS